MLINDEVRALSIRRDVFEIAFTPKGKELIYSNETAGTWSRENRQTGKPGRIIRKLLVKDYKERDIELFNNQLKAEIMCLGDFRIVSGEDICYWYHSDNYYKISGTLGNSCMKYDQCQCYFDVYKDLAKMLICVKDGKLLGRAILWEINGQTYMDRVYVCMDYLEEQFYQYAMDNKWTIRENNSLLYDENSQLWLEASDNYTSPKDLDLKLTCKYKYERFPYMDSFRYFDPDSLILYCSFPSFRTVWLSNTDGYYEAREWVTCECCGEEVSYYEDDDCPFVWSEYLNGYLCEDCAVYNEWIEDYISKDTNVLSVIVNSDRATEDIPRDVVLGNYTSETEEEDYADFVKIGNTFYTSDAVTWSDKENRYIVND